jgi:hypothetical protein
MTEYLLESLLPILDLAVRQGCLLTCMKEATLHDMKRRLVFHMFSICKTSPRRRRKC